ncbi:MAG TPA: ribonuclease III, partial [Dehalococcoidia bacterium]|nr:ribonuclease III [Dehalococcoidia bacterium]
MTGQRLESALGLKFRDPALLQQALVHRSLLNEQGGQPEDSYERMEYLGDAVLELTVST